MLSRLDTISLPLFVPADRPERYAKVFVSGADAAIIDLEDAVAPAGKDAARAALANARELLRQAPHPVLVRVNAAGSAMHEADVALVRQLPVAGVLLAKADSAADVERLAAAIDRPVLALVESARGLAAARSIAATGARLAFGSIDFAADLGCAHTREALLAARSELVLASRLAGVAAPIDGVTVDVRSATLIEDDVRHAAGLGFSGKLLIHPAQVEPARKGFRPTPAEVAWAERILAAGETGGAVSLDGVMVDAPVRLRAEQIRRRQAVGPAPSGDRLP